MSGAALEGKQVAKGQGRGLPTASAGSGKAPRVGRVLLQMSRFGLVGPGFLPNIWLVEERKAECLAHSKDSINRALLACSLPPQSVLEPNCAQRRCCFHLTGSHPWGESTSPPSWKLPSSHPVPKGEPGRPLSEVQPCARCSGHGESSLPGPAWCSTHLPDKWTEAYHGAVTCPGTPNICDVGPRFWRLQSPCVEMQIGPAGDLPGAAR